MLSYPIVVSLGGPVDQLNDVRWRVMLSLTTGRSELSVPGLVVMAELGVCQHHSDLFKPYCPDQDDTSVRFVIGVPLAMHAIDSDRCDSARRKVF